MVPTFAHPNPVNCGRGTSPAQPCSCNWFCWTTATPIRALMAGLMSSTAAQLRRCDRDRQASKAGNPSCLALSQKSLACLCSAPSSKKIASFQRETETKSQGKHSPMFGNDKQWSSRGIACRLIFVSIPLLLVSPKIYAITITFGNTHKNFLETCIILSEEPHPTPPPASQSRLVVPVTTEVSGSSVQWL